MSDRIEDQAGRPAEALRNVGYGERALSVAVGLMLAAAAVKPRPNPLLNLVALAGGVYLAYRGATGHCPLKAEIENGRARLDRLTAG